MRKFVLLCLALATTVAGDAKAQTVTGVNITSSPLVGTTYERGETIEVTVRFSTNFGVVSVRSTFRPSLALTIGSATRQANYASGTGTNSLVFRYTVVAADADTDGIRIGLFALTGNIYNGFGSLVSNLRLPSITTASGHKVNGATLTAAVVSGTAIASSPLSGSTYGVGEQIDVTVTFNWPVNVTGTPQLALRIGTATRQANYASGSGTASLTFQYTVVATDADTDGISVLASALTLNSGAINDARDGTTAASLGLGTNVISNSVGHKVDGTQGVGVSGATIASSPSSGSTYGVGEQISVTVTFTSSVAVTGTPQLALTIGTETRQANYASGTGTASLTFRYTVVASDSDSDGISVGASALTLNSGAIKDASDATVSAALGLGTNAISTSSGHKVIGTAAAVMNFYPTPGVSLSRNHELGQQIEFTAIFTHPVTVTGTPQVALGIGSVTRQMNYVSGTGTATLLFRYTVVASDNAPSGITVARSALTLNGGSINDARDGTTAASLVLPIPGGGVAVYVDGSMGPPGVSDVSVSSSPVTGDTYGLAERIEVVVTFNKAVDVSGTPQLALGIGTETRYADYASGTGTKTLVFRYRVVAADQDNNGISVGASALELNGGEIVIAGGSTAAVLAVGFQAISDDPLHKVSAGGGTDPYFGVSKYGFKLTENEAGPLVVGTVGATDPFGGGLTYVLGDGGEGLFELDASSGALTYVGTGADAELRSEYLMELRAEAGDGRVGTALASVKVLNVNDEAPVFVKEEFPFELEENAAGPVALEVAEAVDLDEGDTLTYRMEAGDAERFEVDGETGEVRYVGAGEDYEGGGPRSWELEVSATDLAGSSARATVVVALTNMNEAPVFVKEEFPPFELKENAAGPVVLERVTATDPDAEDVLTYSLAEGDAARFEVDGASGEVRYVGAGEDYEGGGPGSWELEVSATDLAGSSARATVVVALTNENDAPVFVKEEFPPFELAENAAGPVSLGVAEAVDEDEDDALTYRLEAGDGERFEVDAASGEVRYVGAGEDYEGGGPRSWELEVSATDLAGSSARATVVVALTNENEAPVFVKEEFPFELKENAAGPVSLERVTATDPDAEDVLTYSLAEGDAARFEVDGASGEVRYVGAGEDYEGGGPRSWELEVSATDLAGSSARATVVVALTNENEAPVFVKEEFPFELKENAAGPVSLERVTATDPDAEDVLTYSLAEGDAARFEVDGASGEVRYVGAGEDYEGGGPGSWELEVSATDLAGSSARATVVVALTNENDAPVFVKEEFPFELKENAAGPVSLGVAEAVDEDEDDALTYRLEAGDGERFEVDGETGEVRYVGGGEDYEGSGPGSWKLEVSATDLAGSSVRATVAVALTNMNDAPVFVKEEFPPFELAENAVGPVVLERVTATDPDAEDVLTYSLAEGDAERFEVDGETGEVRYVGGGEDYEGSGPGSWELEVSVADLTGSSARTTVVVALTNVNEAPAFADSAYAFDLAENAVGPVVLERVTATDPDAEDRLTYSLAGGDAARFEVDGTSGEVRYVGAGEDAETGPAGWEFEVVVADRDGLTDRVPATVALVDVNEAPAFADSAYAFDLAENAAGPVSLGPVEATDEDAGDVLTYSLTGGDAARFEVDPTSGEVRYVGAGEDAETGPAGWEFEVVVADRDGLTDRVPATVVLVDVNEAPAFADSAYAFDLAENAAGPVALGPVEATDEDAGDVLTYSLAGGDAARFEVDGTSGEVRYVGAGEDAETGPAGWEFEVVVADRDGLTDRVPATVALVDVNEAPAFADSAYAFDLAENAAGPVALGPVEATDEDAEDRLTYSLAGGDAARFEVDGASGEVRYVGAGEDAETGPAGWEFEVVVADRDGLTDRVPATVALVDVNEAPAFADSAYAFDLAENAAGPVALGPVEATDEDAGDVLTYSLAGGDAARFEVDGTSGEVRYVGAGEDAETGPAGWEFEVVVADRDGLTDRVPATVALVDVNEAPAFADSAYAFDLAENAAGPVALGPVEATDEDAGDVLTYSLAGGDAARFEVDGTSGEVRYVGGGENYEDGPPRYALVVRVVDAGGLADEAGVVVTVLDVNEGPEAVGGIAPKVLEAYGAAAEEEMGPYFRDPDGDALSYAAESSVPGVALAAVTESGRLSIAPQAIGVATVTVRATDPGGLEAVQQVQVTVEASRSERARALKLALAAFGRSLGAETVDAIGGRLGVESSSALGRSHVRLGGRSVGCGEFGGGEECGLATLARGASGLLGARLSHPGGALVGPAGGPGATIDAAALLFGGGGEQGGFGFGGGTYQGQQESAAKVGPGGLEFDPVSRRNLLSQSSFQLSFGGGAALTGTDSLAAAPQAAASRAGWTLWGQASAGEFEGVPDDGFALEGRTRSAYAGLDYRFGSGLLLGLAGSRSGMESDFESGINGAGSVDARLTSLYPYLHWSPREGLGLWGAAGAGRGSADLEELAGGRFSTDLDMRMGALGARQELVGALALKADAFSVRIQSADATEMAGVTANAQRVRLAPELSGQWAVGGASVRTRLELGGRLDRGDAETGLGAEAGAELGFTHRASGFSVDARGRTLLVHQAEDFKEWNASVALRLQPGRDQGGLSFSLEPSWGAGGSGGAGALWQTHGRLGSDPQAMAQHAAADAPGWTPDRLAMELGWGAVLPGGGQVRPFGRWSREGADGYRLNVGTQWSVLGQPGEGQGQSAQGLRLMIDLFGEQVKNTSLQPRERRMGLLGRIEFR